MSLHSETVGNKQPIKRLEIPISKFNDVAIPHHLGMLRRHKTNIAKLKQTGDWDRIYKEQTNASRLVKQLKQLLYEMDVLRGQVQDSDIAKFDQLTAYSRASTMNAIKEYLALDLNLPTMNRLSTKDEDEATNHPFQDGNIQLHAEEKELERQQACLHAWNSLQDDMIQLHQLFVDFNQLVHDQKEFVNRIEENTEETEVNVTEGTKFLEKAGKYKTAAYPIAGALIGTCLGGPVGLIAGLKFGGLTAIGCGLLGFTGGTLLKKKTIKSSTESQAENRLERVHGSDLPSENIKASNKQL
ncbi:syntaxin-17 [Neodiprion pinetum]|uniref:syntaxin-17 n=1 Tax=Neodiprion pinetum TaxID=441929 RepID=UPI001EDE04E9|nr:syntaxin-17 [Neodiprion pinetum]